MLHIPCVKWLFAIAGGLLLAATAIDIVWTTLGTHGSGPLSSHVTTALWKIALARHRRKKNHRALSFAGSTILVATVVFWVTCSWIGWTIVFSGDKSSIVETATHQPASLAARIYYVGAAMTTAGTSDLHANGPEWRFASALAAAFGLGSITLAITYLLAVLSAVVEKRALGAYVSDLGGTPEAIITGAWTGIRFDSLEQHLVQLTAMVHVYTEQHLAFPVLHYFHSEGKRTAAAPAVAVLHETAMILSEALEEERKLPFMVTEPMRGAIRGFCRVIRREFVDPEEKPPDTPPIAFLRALGVPTVDDETFRKRVEEECEVRRTLLALLHDDGWKWHEAVVEPRDT